MKKFWNDFKTFISRGNVVDLAVAVIIGAAFGKIVSSLVDDMVMPLITGIVGKNSIADLFFMVGNSQIRYGNFIQTIIDFLIISFFVFLMIRLVVRAQKVVKSAGQLSVWYARRPKRPKLLKRIKVTKATNLQNLCLSTNKKEIKEVKPTTDELLTQILKELKKQNKDTKDVKDLIKK